MALLAVGGTVAAAPPPVLSTTFSPSAWTECVLESQSGGSDVARTQHFETWLFRTDAGTGFDKFLKHRHFGRSDGDSVSCRDHPPDATISCLECVRVVFGGVYGSIGVIVPAYPTEAMATGCISRSRIVEVDYDDDDNYDGNPTREVALCNSHRGKFDGLSVDA